jgi:hypothetical protein
MAVMGKTMSNEFFYLLVKGGESYPELRLSNLPFKHEKPPQWEEITNGETTVRNGVDLRDRVFQPFRDAMAQLSS